MPEFTDNDRRNVFQLMDDGFGTEYKKRLMEQKILEMSKRFEGDAQAQIAPEPPKEEAKIDTEAPAPEQAPKADDTERSFLESVGTFLKELPGQTTGGVFDAVNAAIDTARDLGEAAGLPNYAVQITNEEGKFSPALLTPEEVEAKGGLSTGVLPEVAPAETVAGGFTRSIANFAAGFIPAAKGLKAAGLASKIGIGMGAGAM